jgi:hypothetical protein
VSDLEVITFRPSPEQYAWTFGGAAPVMRITPPAVLQVFTEDCFAGRVRAETDLVSEVCEFPRPAGRGRDLRGRGRVRDEHRTGGRCY